MSERDPRVEPHPGDVWSWHRDGEASAIVGTAETKNGIWFNDPMDGLPMSHFLSMREFLLWARGAVLIRRAGDRS